MQETPKSPIPNGKAAAALLSGAAGIAFLGIITILAEWLPGLRQMLVLNEHVGALSGRMIVPVLLWVILWLVLDYSWKNRDLDFGKILAATRILLIIGLLGTFPLIFRLFSSG